jgi:crotonobetainyl-CoA:carnitine CoA-transferase CaiB-like acyl-CoA transferase
MDQAAYQFPATRKSNRKPLAGVRIIDAGNMVAAPFAASLLADFGADVIKIEHPKNGDGQRKLEPIKDGIPLWWKTISRNKRCVSLDLSKPDGAAVFKDMVRKADVVVENYRPGTMERWGLGYEDLSKLNPRLIMLRISGFGQTGPYRDRPAFGRIAEAISGLTNLIGDPDGPPMSPGYPLGDLISGLFGAYSVMIALYHRDALYHGSPQCGKGQMIDLALNEAIFRLLDFDAIQFDQLKAIHRRSGNRVSYVAPSSTFKTNDEKYITLAASTQSIWLRVCQAMERDDLVSDPKFIDNPSRVEHSEEINKIVADWIAVRSRREVEDIFERNKVAYSTVFDIEDIFNDIHYRARDVLVRVPDKDLGEAIVQNVVPKFSLTPGSVDHLGPALGEHNDEIYGDELGYSKETLSRLRDAGII